MRNNTHCIRKDFKNQLLLCRLQVQDYCANALSKELTGNLGQLLSSTKMLISLSERELTKKVQVPDALHTAEQTLTSAMYELRRFSKSLTTNWLSNFNLIDKLAKEISEINASANIKITLLAEKENIVLHTDKQLILFCIVQEILAIIYTKANKNNIKIEIYTEGSLLCIRIGNDGNALHGDAVKDNEKKFACIGYRAKLIAGKMEFFKTPAQTVVIIKVSQNRNKV